jgi:hypothetical protein
MSSSNYVYPKRTLPQEKQFIKDNLRLQLQPRHIWQVISAPWFYAWKKYVDYDNNVDSALSEVRFRQLNYLFQRIM